MIDGKQRLACLARWLAATVVCSNVLWAAAGTAQAKLPVVATIFPIADVVTRLGGERVTVVTLLPPGRTPHGYQPRPAQVETLAKAKLLVMVGSGMDEWARRGAAATGKRDIHIVELTKLLPQPTSAPVGKGHQRDGHEHKEDQHQHGGAFDPHIWLDPVLMVRLVERLAEELGRIDPAGLELYRSNAIALGGELKLLDRDYREVLTGVKQRSFVTFHAAFGRLADRYGLTQQAVIAPGHEHFGPRQLERVVRFIRQSGVKVVFAEPQFPPDRLRAIAEQTGAKVGRLDPLGNPLVKGRDSYMAMMRYNLEQLQKALAR